MSFIPEAKFEHETIQDFQDGECIFEEGDSGRDLYIVQRGCVRIMKKTNSGSIVIIEFEKGEFFGEMALLQSLPRSAGAFSKGDTRLLILKQAGFLMKIRRDPTFAFEMLQQMSLRMKTSTDQLFEVLNRCHLPLQEIQEILRAVGEKL